MSNDTIKNLKAEIKELEAENAQLNLEKGMAIMELEGIKIAHQLLAAKCARLKKKNAILRDNAKFWAKRFMEVDTELSLLLKQKRSDTP